MPMRLAAQPAQLARPRRPGSPRRRARCGRLPSDSGRRSRPMTASAVMLLPQPDSPTRPKASPRPISKETFSTALNAAPSPCKGRCAGRRPRAAGAFMPRLVCDCGSRMSRRPSPSRLRPSTVKKIARPGKTDSHGAVRDLVARLRQHAAPAREGRADAEAEEGERGLGQDGAAHAERGDHDQRPQDVGQDLGEHDAQVAVAQDARGLDVALALQRQDLGAGDAAGVGPVGEPERDHAGSPGRARGSP